MFVLSWPFSPCSMAWQGDVMHASSWATVETSGILHWFCSALSSPTRFFYPESCTFSSRKSSCDMYPVQPNELPDKVHSTASICWPKETTLSHGKRRGFNPAVLWQSEVLGGDPSRWSNYLWSKKHWKVKTALENTLSPLPGNPFLSMGIVKPCKIKFLLFMLINS